MLREFAIKGYVLDRKRMENGSLLGEDYFERLLAEIRESGCPRTNRLEPCFPLHLALH